MLQRQDRFTNTLAVVGGFVAVVFVCVTSNLSLAGFTVGMLLYICFVLGCLVIYYHEKSMHLGMDVSDLELQLQNVLADHSTDNVMLVGHWYSLWSSLDDEEQAPPIGGGNHLVLGEN